MTVKEEQVNWDELEGLNEQQIEEKIEEILEMMTLKQKIH